MRKLLVVASSLLLLAVIAVAIAAWRLDAYLSAHQARLVAQVSAALGRPVSFDAVSVSMRLAPLVRISNVRVADDPGGGGEDLLRVGTVSLWLDPLWALFGELRVRRVTLETPVITIVRTTSGTNVDTLGRPAPADASPAPPRSAAAPAPGPGGGGGRDPVTVARASIRNGTLRYIDQRRNPPERISLTAIDLDAGNLGATQTSTFEMRAALFGAADQNLAAAGTVSLQPGATFDLTVRTDGVIIDTLRQLPEAAAWLPEALSSPAPVRANLTLQGTPGHLQLRLDGDATTAALRYGDWLDKPPGVPLAVRVDGAFTGATGVVEVRSATFTVASLTANLSGTVERGTPPRVDLGLTVPATALTELAAVVPALAGRGASGSIAVDLHARGAVTPTGIASMTGRIDLQQVGLGSPDLPGRISNLTTPLIFSGDAAELATTTVTVGTTPVQIVCRAAPLDAPAADCTLSAAALEPGDLGIDAVEGDRLETFTLTASLRPLDPTPAMQVTVQSASGRIQGIALQNLQVQARARDGEFVIERGSAQTLGGAVQVSGTYLGARRGVPEFDLRGQADRVQLRDLLASQGVRDADRFDGRVQGNFALTGAGHDSSAVAESLRGTARVDVTGGVVRDFDLDSEALGELSPLVSSRVRRRHPELFGGDLRFQEAGGSFRIADRRVATDDTRVRSNELGVDARGTLDFDGDLDLRGTLTLSPALTGDVFGGSTTVRQVSNAAGGMDVSFTLGGTLEKPRLRLGAEVLADALGRGVESLVGGGAEGGKRVGELLKKGLDSLFDR